jgi:DNA-binding CsgD family transcriptional regulator/PAS domain-containing protein
VGTGGVTAEEIYSALLDDEAFGNLPARLAESFGARSTVVHWHHHDGAADILAHSNYFSDEQLNRYANQFAALDPWAESASRRQANEAIDLETLVPSSLYERSIFYNEFIRPMGDDTYRCMGVRIENSDGAGMIAIQRGKSQDSFEPELVARLSDASAHLRRLLAVRGKFAALQRHSKKLESMLDYMPHAVFVVDQAQRLTFANTGGEALIRRGDAIAVRTGRLHGVARNSERLLKRALELACCPTPTSSAVLIEHPRGKPLPATIMPLSGCARHALIIVQDATHTNAGLITQLQAFFGLTAAEAMIGTRLADGLSLPDIAAIRGVSVATVRAQLKSLLQKMDCHRQSELVSVVKGIIPVPPRRPPGA